MPSFLIFGLERLPRNSESRGRARWARDAAVAFAQRFLDQRLFTLGEIRGVTSLLSRHGVVIDGPTSRATVVPPR